ncbi:hypothetical protein JHL17_21440 [Azospirillum sp. YIM B02556]|uniref:Uncharacterized protein n=1 Tax=Azospirillum endophyticum TaxID=2800326 RepID=A0ABS1F990_9PROT|nr:hypothetical protein [Azospirillum endophyticum]MBK1839974.1 hypothetical protein [Azospirillum endophyticum]
MDKTCTPLFRAISDVESPLTSAEAAVTTLNIITNGLGRGDEEAAIVYLADMIETHLSDLRKRFRKAWDLARMASIDGPAERIASAVDTSTIIPSLDQTFAAASAMVLTLFDEHAAAAKAGSDNLPDHLVVEACDIRRAVFTTPPKTSADAMAVLELLAHDVAGMGQGNQVEAQETALALLRDFMKSVAG